MVTPQQEFTAHHSVAEGTVEHSASAVESPQPAYDLGPVSSHMCDALEL